MTLIIPLCSTAEVNFTPCWITRMRFTRKSASSGCLGNIWRRSKIFLAGASFSLSVDHTHLPSFFLNETFFLAAGRRTVEPWALATAAANRAALLFQDRLHSHRWRHNRGCCCCCCCCSEASLVHFWCQNLVPNPLDEDILMANL